MEQGVAEVCGGQFQIEDIGDFLRWISNDLMKESGAELEAAGLRWKQVQRKCTARARDWYRIRCS